MTRQRTWWLQVVAAALVTWCATAATAATAVQVPLQGTARTLGGGPVADGAYVFFLRLYDGPTAVKPVWQEVNANVQIEGGLFAVNAGAVEGAGVPLALFSAAAPLWLGVQIGSDPELARVPLGTTPYAAFAHQAQVAASASFPWAAADQPGGAAKSLSCTGCVGAEQLAAASVAASHVAFGYAASDQKGGSATHALAADIAKVADQAQFAVTAKSAEQAQKAALADNAAAAKLASDLQCSGCIGPDHLSAQVAQAFLSTQGGVVAGKVTIQGGLDLGDGILSGGQFATIDTSQAACTPNLVGRVVVDGAQKRLYFCDGSSWRRLSSCTGACKDAALVACGQPISDDCGELGICAGKGSFCAVGQSCSGGTCVAPGQSKDAAVKSCKALLAAVPATKSGLFWLDPDGGDSANAFQAWCDMTTDGGGWTLVMKLAAGNFCFGAATWSDSQPYNADKMLTASMPGIGEYDAKSAAFYALTDASALRFDTSRSKSVQVSFVQPSSPRTLMTTNTIDFAAYPNYSNWAAAFGHDRSQAPIFMRAGVAVTKGNTCRNNPGNTPSGCGKPCVFCYQAADGSCCGCDATANDVNSGVGQNAAYCGGGQGICSTAGAWSDSELRTLVWAR